MKKCKAIFALCTMLLLLSGKNVAEAEENNLPKAEIEMSCTGEME